MNIEHIIRAWKSDEDNQDANSVANPVGEELTEQELLEVSGGLECCGSADGAHSAAGSLLAY